VVAADRPNRYCFERADGIPEWDKVQKMQVVSHGVAKSQTQVRS